MTRQELEKHVREMLKDDGLHAFISLDDVAAVYEDYLLLIQEGRELRAALDSAEAKGVR